MNIYQSFIKETSTEIYETDWRYFACSFPELIESDKNLDKLLKDNELIEEKWNEVRDDIKYTIEEELALLPYVREDLMNENSLILEVISIADSVLKANLLKSLSDDYIDTATLPQRYIFLEDDQAIQHRTNDLEQLIEGDDREVLKELTFLDNRIKKFELDREGLISNLYKSGFKTNVQRRLIQRIPIITQLDYFDPSVYTLLKEHPELLNTLDWRIFEELLADILKTFGYVIELTRKTKDGGIDVIAIKKDNDFGQHKYILQAKRYTHSVQVSPVRELLYLHSEQRASKSCLATTSTFTKGAWELADKHRWTLELKDRDGILKWIDKVINIRKR